MNIIDAAHMAWAIRRGVQLEVPRFREQQGWGVVWLLAETMTEDGRVQWGWRTVSGGAHPDDTDVWAATQIGPEEVVVCVAHDPQFPEFAILPLTPPEDVSPMSYWGHGARRWYQVTENAPDKPGTILRHIARCKA